MIARFAAAIGIGAAVTFGLLFVMQLLIAQRGDLNERREYNLRDFVRVEREQTVERKEREVEPPPDPLLQPQMPMVSNRESFNTKLNVSLDTPVIRTGVEMKGLGFGVSDGEYLPLHKVQPQYPMRAAQRGLEGYVIVQFTVTTQGTTKDIEVVESSNVMFERSALEAAAKFKYRPRVVNGEPVEVPGVLNKITFVLQN